MLTFSHFFTLILNVKSKLETFDFKYYVNFKLVDISKNPKVEGIGILKCGLRKADYYIFNP